MCVVDIEDRLIAWAEKYPSSSIDQIREEVRRLCQNTSKISAQLAERLESTTSLETFQREHRFDVLFFQPSEPFVLHYNISPASPEECLPGSPFAVPQKGNVINGSDCFSDFAAENGSFKNANTLMFQEGEDRTPAFYQSSNQPCGDKGVKSEFCQVPAATSSALELPPINSFAVPPTFSQICNNDYTTFQSTDFVFEGAGCGESGHGEDAKCWNNSNYRAWVGLPSHIQVSYL
ncbi:uncharacterized protein PpBr36_10447 [Pyricularia pennisetigena]|uniref:uncharacterized protein n=1 Tax=Pyricularia pennisetigena TaxID=1578925 RepID=UPI00114D9D30|nr:uncharacterized protein PpBr36_10447 [Pyricularia pennisetigena]TLS21143.1 hypothetical protein PpBr36_10447 [Pyricularia pennisetigena]